MAVAKITIEARERWKRCAESEDPQRKSMLEAKQFRAGEQWDEAIRIQRQGGQSLQGQAAQPPRPCLVVDRISPAVRQVSNTIRQANFAIDVMPNGHGADDETADIYKGIIRRIQNQARDEEPIEWAADNAAECGLGWFRLLTRYVATPPSYTGPEVFDQDVILGRVTNTFSVYVDPTAVKPTKADAQYMLVTEDLSKGEFKRRYPKADFASLDEFSTTGDDKTWVTEETVRIAEYWRIEHERRTVLELEDGSIVDGDTELPDETVVKKTRTISQPVVKWSKINAVQVLPTPAGDPEEGVWAGSHIPFIPILGEELNVDGKPLYRGVVQSAMDAQRMVNYTYSAAMETAALAPKSPLIIAEGQVEGYKSLWDNANRFNYSYLPYKPVSLAGTPVPPPQRQVAEPPIQAMVQMMIKSEDCIKATTQVYDPGLGNTNPKERSGKAIMALQQQGELGNSNYLDNVNRAMVYAGELLVELIPKIYDRPGRIVQILGIDDEPSPVMLGQPFTVKGGKAQPAVDGQGNPILPGHPMFQQGLHQFYDLTRGQYAVTVSVGKAFTTRRQEGTALMAQMLDGNPQLMQVFGDLFFRDLDTPGAAEISERLKKLLPPQLQDNEEQPPVPPAVQAQMQQSQKMIQELTAHVNQLTQTIQEKTIENKTKLQIAQMDNDTQIKKAIIQAMSVQTATQAKLDAENARTFIDAEENKLSSLLDLHMKKLDAVKDMLSQTHSQAHEVGLTAMEHAHELELASQQHQNALEQQAAAPEPVSAGE